MTPGLLFNNMMLYIIKDNNHVASLLILCVFYTEIFKHTRSWLNSRAKMH